MSSFSYIKKDGKFYLVIGGRMKIHWSERWIPSAASVTVLPSEIELSKSSYTLKIEGSYTLSATVLPADTTDKSVVWSSSDETIATVSDGGKVTAVAIGECVITAASKVDSSISAECAITVEAKE